MDESTPRTLHIEAIRNDLNRIVDEWLHLHFRLLIILVAIALTLECLLAFVIADAGILNTTITIYILKFIVMPSALAVLCLLCGLVLLRGKRLTQKFKIYAISLLFVLVCFIYYTIHSAFFAIYALYAFAIFLTTTYADHRLTNVVSLVSITSLIASELFLHWDMDKVSIFADPDRMVNFLVALSLLLGCSLVSGITIRYERKKNEASLRREAERELLKESLRFDELTGIFNRKALHDALRELEQTGAQDALVFGIADIDYFKTVNDVYGHQAGDHCLIEFSCVLSECFGESAVYRYGGDEFCLILHGTTLEEAVRLCEHAQLRLRRAEFEEVPELKPTASFGLAAYSKEDGVSHLFLQADEALYEAKRIHNAVRVYSGASDMSFERVVSASPAAEEPLIHSTAKK